MIQTPKVFKVFGVSKAFLDYLFVTAPWQLLPAPAVQP